MKRIAILALFAATPVAFAADVNKLNPQIEALAESYVVKSFADDTPENLARVTKPDDTLKLCSQYRDNPPKKQAKKLVEREKKNMKYPDNGVLMGDWSERGLPHRHHVGMVAEDGQRVGGERARRLTCIANGVNSPAILNMSGIMSRRPCDAVKVVRSAPACRAPWSAPAAPPSDCISMMEGTLPQTLFLPGRDHSSAHSAMGEDGVMG